MKILKQLSSDIDWGFWSTILAIFFGWMLNELSQWFKVKNEEKQIVKRVIFELLEINYILQKSDIEGFMSSAVERILNKIPDDVSKESLKLSLEVGLVKVLKESHLSKIKNVTWDFNPKFRGEEKVQPCHTQI